MTEHTDYLRLADEAEAFAKEHKYNGQALYPQVLDLASAIREQAEAKERDEEAIHDLRVQRVEMREEVARLREELERKDAALQPLAYTAETIERVGSPVYTDEVLIKVPLGELRACRAALVPTPEAQSKEE